MISEEENGGFGGGKRVDVGIDPYGISSLFSIPYSLNSIQRIPPAASAATRLRASRSVALTVHRTVIHYRRLRFAYPLGKGGFGERITTGLRPSQ